jgi:hypothetical protein
VALLDLDLDPRPRALRVFGAILFVLLVGGSGYALWAYSLWHQPDQRFGGEPLWALLGLGVLAGVLAVAWPRALRPVYVAVAVATWPLAFVLSWVVLGVVWFLVITPAGFLRRALGRDPLTLRAPPSGESLWRSRPPPRDPEGYFRPY